LILAWGFKITKLREHANESSDFLIGKWWDILIKYVVPTILIFILIVAIAQNILEPPFDYPGWIIIVGGVAPIVFTFLLSFIFAKIKKGTEVE